MELTKVEELKGVINEMLNTQTSSLKEEIEKSKENYKLEAEARKKENAELAAKVEKVLSLPWEKVRLPGTSTEVYKGFRLNAQFKKPEIAYMFANESDREMYAKVYLDVISNAYKEAEKKRQMIGYEKSQILEGTPTTGGAAVPVEFTAGLEGFARLTSVAMQFCRLESMASETRRFTRRNAGTTIYQVDEGIAITPSTPTIEPVTITAKRLGALTVASAEALADMSYDVVSELASDMGEKLGQYHDGVVFGEFTDPWYGILSDQITNDVDMVAGETSIEDLQNAGSGDYFSKMVSLLPSNKKAGARFFFHREILHFIRTSKTTLEEYVFAQPGNGVPGTLWEYPYTEVEAMPALANDGTAVPFVAFGNLRNYIIGVRKSDTTLAVDPYTYFANDEVQFKLSVRYGYVILQPTAFVRLLTAVI